MDSEWQEEPDNQRKASTPGAALAAQREAMGLTIEQVADQLKLAQRQVIAIENGDYAALPNMAVTRGFIRAYAKVLRMDPAPLVAMVEVEPAPVIDVAAPRRDMGASFSESRFPSMTRQSKPSGLIAFGLVAVVVAAAIGAWQAGLISPQMLSANGSAGDAASAAADSNGVASTPLPAPSVPLASVPAPAPADSAAGAPATDTAAATPAPAAGTLAAAVPATGAPAAAPGVTPAPAAAAPAPAAAAATPAAAATAPGTLVLTVVDDSWIEIRRPGNLPSLIARLVKGGSTETFEIDGQALLIVGKPGNVRATLRGQHLDLPVVANGTIARVQIK